MCMMTEKYLCCTATRAVCGCVSLLWLRQCELWQNAPVHALNVRLRKDNSGADLPQRCTTISSPVRDAANKPTLPVERECAIDLQRELCAGVG